MRGKTSESDVTGEAAKRNGYFQFWVEPAKRDTTHIDAADCQ